MATKADPDKNQKNPAPIGAGIDPEKSAKAHEAIHKAEIKQAEAIDERTYPEKFVTSSNDPRAHEAVEMSNDIGTPVSSTAVATQTDEHGEELKGDELHQKAMAELQARGVPKWVMDHFDK